MTYHLEPGTRTSETMQNPIKILYLYEEECDLLAINETLQKAGFSFEKKMVNSKEKFEKSLGEFLPDIILSEETTSSFSSLDALQILKTKGLKIPLILVSGQLPIEQIIEIIKAGASDYVRKDHPERLPVAIDSALEKNQLDRERQEYIDKLESVESRYRALIEHAVDAVVILNKEGKPTYASPSIERVLGYTEAETLELSLYEVVHPDELPAIKLRMAECLEKPGISLPVIQCRCKHKNGKWVWYEGTVTNMLHDPAINGIVDNFHDISDKKSAELDLRESEEKYRSVFETSLDAILLTVTDGRILAANPAACQMFQMTEEEICSVGRDGLVVKRGPELESILAERKKNGKITGQLTFRRKNGSLFQGEISSAIFSNSNGINRTSMVIRDISERVKTERELKVSEENYRFLVTIQY